MEESVKKLVKQYKTPLARDNHTTIIPLFNYPALIKSFHDRVDQYDSYVTSS